MATPGIPEMVCRDFSEHGKLRESSGKNCNKENIFCSSFKYLCKTWWETGYFLDFRGDQSVGCGAGWPICWHLYGM